MAKVHGKVDDTPKEMNVEDLTNEQIMQLAQWANILNEENKNLKGYIVQLQAQLQKARGDRAVAQYNFDKLNSQVITTETHVTSDLHE
jgi:hypothetical protein